MNLSRSLLLLKKEQKVKKRTGRGKEEERRLDPMPLGFANDEGEEKRESERHPGVMADAELDIEHASTLRTHYLIIA